MGRVADILAVKGDRVLSIPADSTVYDAIKTMVGHNVGSVVIADGTAVLGIFTERDYLRRIVLEGRTSKTTRVRDVMTERLVCVDPDRSIAECMAIMTRERIRHLPVIDRAKLAGIVSIGDLVKHQSAEQEVEIRYLTDYITGKYPG